MSTLPIELQGEGTYNYECKKRDCWHCELMEADKKVKPNYYTRLYGNIGLIVYKKRETQKKSA